MYRALYRINILIIAPLLIILLFVMILAGYAQVKPSLIERITLGLINSRNASTIHLNAHPILWTLAVLHAAINLRVRWIRYLGKWVDMTLVSIWALLTLLVIYLRLSI